jgi:hypothetical protein
MPERLVRFNDSFFDDLDDQLLSERSASGSPSATDEIERHVQDDEHDDD